MRKSLEIELELEDDGRWIGEAVDFPGVLVYGSTREEAKAKVKALAEQVMQEQSS
jgi:predicted RNase H-like HicB family nuclease